MIGAGTFPFVLPVETGIHGGVTVGGYALTSSRSVVEGAPSHPYSTMGTASECGTTTTYLVLPVETGIQGGVTVGGVRSYVEPVRSRRCAQPPGPHHGYRIGVRYDDNLPRLTGGNRYPWWGDGGGYALTSSRSVVEGAPGHAYPTMDTASGCGTTVWCVGADGCGGRALKQPRGLFRGCFG